MAWISQMDGSSWSGRENPRGYRFTNYLQAKLQYSLTHQDTDVQEGEHLVGAQLTLKF